MKSYCAMTDKINEKKLYYTIIDKINKHSHIIHKKRNK